MQPRMTSIHMNTSESQATTPTSTINGTTNNNQAQSNASRYDESDRVRKHREELRRHHAEAASIHQRTQPMIDDEIRHDTLKYIKSGQVNGTKPKNQKPRATKRQRPSTSSSNNSANTSISTTINNNNVINQSQVLTPMGAIGTNNGVQHHQHLPPQPQPQPQQQQAHSMVPSHSQQQHFIQQQATPRAQPVMSTGMQPMHHISSYSPHQMQPSMHSQQQRQPQPSQMQPGHSYNDSYNQPNQYQSQPIYPQRHQMPPTSHGVAPQTMHSMNQNQQQHYYAQQDHQSFYQSQPMMNGSHNHHHYNSLPNDLDLNIQAGLECDIDSLIKHEVSIEGQLNFNPDLFRLIDGHYDHHHHQPNLQ